MVTTVFDELDSKIKDRLSGISVLVDGVNQDVPVVYAYPEEWFSQQEEEARAVAGDRQYPIIAFHKYLPELDRLRYSAGAYTLAPNPLNENSYLVGGKTPFKMRYRVEVITEFTRHRNQLMIEILKRLPQYGLGTVITIYPETENEQMFTFECTAIAEDKVPTGKYYEKRKFRDVYIYEFSICLSVEELEEVNKILDISLDFSTVNVQNNNIGINNYTTSYVQGKGVLDNVDVGTDEQTNLTGGD